MTPVILLGVMREPRGSFVWAARSLNELRGFFRVAVRISAFRKKPRSWRELSLLDLALEVREVGVGELVAVTLGGGAGS